MEMKPYKIKCEVVVIPNQNATGVDIKNLFVCDKTKCPKGFCEQSDCFQTTDINYAKRFDLNE